jgi:hypothetical protein
VRFRLPRRAVTARPVRGVTHPNVPPIDTMFSMTRSSGFATLLALLLISFPLAAQSLSSGSVSGVVRDEAGVPVPGAMLTLIHEVNGTTRAVTPGAGGRFDVSVVPPGEYSLRVEQFGYRPYLLTGLVVRPGQRLQLTVDLTPVAAAAEEPSVERLRGAILAGTGAGLSTEVPPGRVVAFPTHRRELTDLARLSSLSSPDLEMQGLPAWLSGIRIDGVALGTVESAALLPGSARGAALPIGMFDRASIAATNPDVEWSAVGGALEGFSARGGRGAGTEAFGSWGEDVIQGGFRVAGAVIPDTASFLVGVEASRYTRSSPMAGVTGPEVDPVQWIAQEVYGVGPGGSSTSDRFVGFANLAWQLSANTHIDTRASFASIPSSTGDLLAAPSSGVGRPYEGRDYFVGTTVTSRLTDRIAQEFRLSVDGVSRDFDDVDPLGIASTTRVLSSGAALGPEGIRPRSFSRTAVRVSEALHLALGDHRLKLGLAADFGSVDAEQGVMAETFFSDADAFEAGQAYVVRTEVARGSSSFGAPRGALFAQDSWNVGNGLDLLFGVRLDVERLPTGDVALNQEWLDLTGMDNRDVKERWMRLSPRFGLRWDVQNRHEWVVTGSGGVYSGHTDPFLLASWISGDGTARVSRGAASWTGWPSTPTALADAAPTLTLLNPTIQAPRTFRGDAGISRSLGPGTAIRLGALYRHTDFLPRASDLNLALDPEATDQHGRPVFGQLRQQGGILYAEGGSNRRFHEFDQVIAIDADGSSTYRGFTAAVEHRASPNLDAFASYTFSRTEDNWSPAGYTAAGADLSPRLGGTGDWMEGVSNFDVPHRLVVGVEAGTPALAGLRAAVLYRYASGSPFTPGFRAGVDANGDGSSRNDPAFIDPQVPGTETLLEAWSCLREQSGAFAERNSCRGEARQSLDARLSLGFLRAGRYTAALVVDALDLLASESPVHDSALYLVDPAGEVTRDGDGRVTVPLIANEQFGRSIGALHQGRSIRLGLRLSY